VHAVVYEKVPRAIKFTGSVLHRVARVALSLSLSLSLSRARARAPSRSLPLSFLSAHVGYGGLETREAR